MRLNTLFFFLCLLASSVLCAQSDPPETLDEVFAKFLSPPAAFRPAPLYVWNDRMDKEELAWQIKEFKDQGFGGLFIHPRPGLITPYLSKEWLELWLFTVNECEKQGLVTYIYDENSYPSGFAGGLVPDAHPEFRLVGLKRAIVPGHRINKDHIALYKLKGALPLNRIRLTIDPEGDRGRITISGLSSTRFIYKGGPFQGGNRISHHP